MNTIAQPLSTLPQAGTASGQPSAESYPSDQTQRDYAINEHAVALGTIRTIQNLLAHTGARISPSSVRTAVRQHSRFIDFSLLEIDQLLKQWGFATFAVKIKPELLSRIDYPAIAHIKEEDTYEFVLLTGFEDDQLCYLHPGSNLVKEPVEAFEKKWEGAILMIAGDESIEEEGFEEKSRTEQTQQHLYQTRKIKIVENFLSAEDCERIIAFSNHLYKRSQVTANGESIISPRRTSQSAVLAQLDTPLREKILAKVKDLLTGLPYREIEELQSVCYQTGQEFRTHFDADKHMQRLYTILIYLNDDFEGGATFFPELNLSIQPRQGKAVLFHNLNEDGTINLYSLHAGLPVTQGVKYACNVWVRG